MAKVPLFGMKLQLVVVAGLITLVMQITADQAVGHIMVT